MTKLMMLKLKMHRHLKQVNETERIFDGGVRALIWCPIIILLIQKMSWPEAKRTCSRRSRNIKKVWNRTDNW